MQTTIECLAKDQLISMWRVARERGSDPVAFFDAVSRRLRVFPYNTTALNQMRVLEAGSAVREDVNRILKPTAFQATRALVCSMASAASLQFVGYRCSNVLVATLDGAAADLRGSSNPLVLLAPLDKMARSAPADQFLETTAMALLEKCTGPRAAWSFLEFDLTDLADSAGSFLRTFSRRIGGLNGRAALLVHYAFSYNGSPSGADFRGQSARLDGVMEAVDNWASNGGVSKSALLDRFECSGGRVTLSYQLYHGGVFLPTPEAKERDRFGRIDAAAARARFDSAIPKPLPPISAYPGIPPHVAVVVQQKKPAEAQPPVAQPAQQPVAQPAQPPAVKPAPPVQPAQPPAAPPKPQPEAIVVVNHVAPPPKQEEKKPAAAASPPMAAVMPADAPMTPDTDNEAAAASVPAPRFVYPPKDAAHKAPAKTVASKVKAPSRKPDGRTVFNSAIAIKCMKDDDWEPVARALEAKQVGKWRSVRSTFATFGVVAFRALIYGRLTGDVKLATEASKQLFLLNDDLRTIDKRVELGREPDREPLDSLDPWDQSPPPWLDSSDADLWNKTADEEFDAFEASWDVPVRDRFASLCKRVPPSPLEGERAKKSKT